MTKIKSETVSLIPKEVKKNLVKRKKKAFFMSWCLGGGTWWGGGGTCAYLEERPAVLSQYQSCLSKLAGSRQGEAGFGVSGSCLLGASLLLFEFPPVGVGEKWHHPSLSSSN